jgi:hypothetical protein
VSAIAERAFGTDTRDGLATLGQEATQLLARLDGIFTGWARAAGAVEVTLPALLPVAELERLEVYRNFPHLALVATTLDPPALAPDAGRSGELPADALNPARLGMPSAVCYGMYLALAGQVLPDDVVLTSAGTCYRNEDHYDGLRRLRAFRMREVVALGDPEHTLAHLERFTALNHDLADQLGIPMTVQPANDPFFDPDGPQARWQRMVPVKNEFVTDDLAIASVNNHSTFFGERCGIRAGGTGAPISTSCAAFGLERWASVLFTRYEGDWGAALDAVLRVEPVRSAATDGRSSG